MHTDEYEITIGREIALCSNIIKRLRAALQKREQRYGMTTEELLKDPRKGGLTVEGPEMVSWRDDHQELEKWEQRLREYEKALEMVKKI